MNIKEFAQHLPYCDVIHSSDTGASKYGYDKSTIHGNRDFIVVFPYTTKALQKILSTCYDFDIPVVPRGAGSGLTGGAVPLQEGVILSFERMNKIISFDKRLGIVKVEPGVITADLQHFLEEQGYFFPPAPNSQGISTIGGNLFHNSSGPRSYKYGSFGEFLLGIQIICMDGTLLNFGDSYSRGFVGYNLCSLMIGSEGTLAVATEISLKVLPIPEYRILLMIETNSIIDSAKVSELISYNNNAISTVDLVGKDASNCLQSTIPEFKLKKTNPSLIMVELEGSKDVINSQLSYIRNTLEPIEDIYIQEIHCINIQKQIWYARNNLYLYLKQAYPCMAVEDICVPPQEVAYMLSHIEQNALARGITWCAIGNIGEGNLHIGITNTDKIDQVARDSFFKEILTTACLNGGAISFEHGVAAKKKDIFTKTYAPEFIELHQRLKATFDPKNLLNPGKMFETIK